MSLTDEQLLNAAVKAGLIDAGRLEQLRQDARRQRVALLGKVLAHYRLPVSALYRAVADLQGVRFVHAVDYPVARQQLRKLPGSMVRRKLVLPLQHGSELLLAMADGSDVQTLDMARRLIGQALTPVMAEPRLLQLQIDRELGASAPAENPPSLAETDLVALLDEILQQAWLNRASDIHLLTEATGLRVRLRIDGRLQDYPVKADAGAATGLISRVKVLAGLDIAEQRQPQDGGFAHKLPPPVDKEFNIRVATAPTRLGERITMRLLSQQAESISLSDLGLLDQDLARFQQAIRRPYGMILLTGPTGSGKSTTLFAALQAINRPDINIMTVENPIEYVMDDISQIQTGPKISFADALRSLLRHDPDVLMVGEIRDAETADVAVKAAMTGHLVFSTLHTNNAVSAVTRLVDIGCEPFLIGSVMTAVIAQRLVRRLCTHCREPRQASADELRLLNSEQPLQIHMAKGCAACQGTGYRGRIGLFETLWFDEQLARMVARGADEEALEQAAGDRLQFMWQDGCEKVRLGLTTLNEVRDVALFKSLPQQSAA